MNRFYLFDYFVHKSAKACYFGYYVCCIYSLFAFDITCGIFVHVMIIFIGKLFCRIFRPLYLQIYTFIKMHFTNKVILYGEIHYVESLGLFTEL